MVLLLAIILPLLHFNTPTASPGAEAGVIERKAASTQLDLVPRQADDICVRWSQQSAIVNGTVYLYGGQATTEPSQTSNTWSERSASRLTATALAYNA